MGGAGSSFFNRSASELFFTSGSAGLGAGCTGLSGSGAGAGDGAGFTSIAGAGSAGFFSSTVAGFADSTFSEADFFSSLVMDVVVGTLPSIRSRAA